MKLKTKIFMCGISGSWNFEMNVEDNISLLKHRGPDSCSYFKDNKTILTSNRLSIIDPEKGEQPIFNEKGDIMIVYNGEFYNHLIIRKILKNHSFKSESDTETILHLYEKMGERCFDLIDGMFAFCIYDGKKLFLARDRFGIKPLYYVFNKKFFVFSSEKKLLFFHGFKENDIKILPPGSFMIYDGLNLKIKKYYEIHEPKKKIKNQKTAIKIIREGLIKAVKSHELSDVELGAFLSGGVDSSIVCSILHKDYENLKTFTTGLKYSEDMDFARIFSKSIGIKNYRKIFSEKDVYKILPKVIFHLEDFEPLVIRNSIPTFFVSELAKKYVKVVLCGEGSDELFAGYSVFSTSKNLDKDIIKHLKRLDRINLNRVDKMTMANSIEARVPFLDHNFVSQALRISKNLKIKGLEKYILRMAFKEDVMKEIIKRPKVEFQKGAGIRYFLKNSIVEKFGSEIEFYKKFYSKIFYSQNDWNNKFFEELGKEVVECLT